MYSLLGLSVPKQTKTSALVETANLNILLGISFALSVNGNSYLYNLFQKLWYPLFIPSLSLFFTAILIEAVYNKFTE